MRFGQTDAFLDHVSQNSGYLHEYWAGEWADDFMAIHVEVVGEALDMIAKTFSAEKGEQKAVVQKLHTIATGLAQDVAGFPDSFRTDCVSLAAACAGGEEDAELQRLNSLQEDMSYAGVLRPLLQSSKWHELKESLIVVDPLTSNIKRLEACVEKLNSPVYIQADKANLEAAFSLTVKAYAASSDNKAARPRLIAIFTALRIKGELGRPACATELAAMLDNMIAAIVPDAQGSLQAGLAWSTSVASMSDIQLKHSFDVQGPTENLPIFTKDKELSELRTAITENSKYLGQLRSVVEKLAMAPAAVANLSQATGINAKCQCQEALMSILSDIKPILTDLSVDTVVMDKWAAYLAGCGVNEFGKSTQVEHLATLKLEVKALGESLLKMYVDSKVAAQEVKDGKAAISASIHKARV